MTILPFFGRKPDWRDRRNEPPAYVAMTIGVPVERPKLIARSAQLPCDCEPDDDPPEAA